VCWASIVFLLAGGGRSWQRLSRQTEIEEDIPMLDTIIVPLELKALTDEQLLAVYNRWSTKLRKKFDNRLCAERAVARLLDELMMTVEEACAPLSGDEYGGAAWDAAFPQDESVESEQDPAGPPEATSEERTTPNELTELPAEAAEPEPRTMETTALAVGGLPEPEKPTRKPLGTSSQTMFDLASREVGASHKELMAAIGWKAGPSWPREFRRLSRRTGTHFRQQKVNGEMRYYLS
jgi:hypothetical protein